MVQSVCVCGAGTMGAGIAQAAAQAGITTILFDLNVTVLQQAEQSIQSNLRKLVEKQKISQTAMDAIIGRIQYSDSLDDCKAEVIIEAIIEKPEAKIALFQQLAAINATTTVFASNTSSLSISLLQQSIPQPERFAGMHFFNPATIMKLVEIVKGEQTSETVITLLQELAIQMQKVPVLCTDAPGFIVNRVARPYYIEALRLLEEETASIETIDALMEASGFKMGPFRLMDLIGNDINYAVSCSVYEQMGQPARLKPSAIQKEKVTSHQLGRKTGKGYYNYND